ncbi:MAG: ABC transporter permease [Propioniciclava sp.]
MRTWSMSWAGIRTVAWLDLRQRVRSPRWIIALVAWFVLIIGLSALVIVAVESSRGSGGMALQGEVFSFGLVTYLLLGMSLVIAPTFTATAINGDREHGTLALLQATRLSAAEIAAGKLLAAWLTSAMFLGVSLPFVIWSLVAGEIPVWQVVVCFAVMMVEVMIVCAIGLGWSAMIGRPTGSTVLTYLTVVLVTALTPIIMALVSTLTRTEITVREWNLSPAAAERYDEQVEQYLRDNPDADGTGMPAPPLGECAWSTSTELQPRNDQVWWILAVNPFVIVADAAPLPESARSDLASYVSVSEDPLISLQFFVRGLRLPPVTERDFCTDLYEGNPAYQVIRDSNGNVVRVTTAEGTPVEVETPVTRPAVTAEDPIWPWGLGVSFLAGAAFFWIAVRRLRVPYGTLPRGTRIG